MITYNYPKFVLTYQASWTPRNAIRYGTLFQL